MAEHWMGGLRGSRLELRIPGKSQLQLSSFGGQVTGVRPLGMLAKSWCLTPRHQGGLGVFLCGQGHSRNVLFALPYAHPISPLSSSRSLSYSCSSFSGEPAGLFLPHILSLQQSISKSHPSIC